MIKWLDSKGTDKDVVISTRIRLARNLKGVKFPQSIDENRSEEIIARVKNSILTDDSINKEYSYHRLKEINPIDRKTLVEEHIISPGLLQNIDNSGYLLRKDQKVTIMINEEDHIRMQILYPGLDLEKAWEQANKLDDVIEKKINYAFDEKLGYLTACPTNIGTGMRASVMLHLPSLVYTNEINRILQAVNQIGLTVRGLYGEGSNAIGNLFQISNQTTLGETEEEIIEKLKSIVIQIINKERKARKAIYNNMKIDIEDKVYRSIGILQNARILTSKEAMDLLSDVKMGIEMDIIENIEANTINKLMIQSQPANIQKRSDKDLTSRERDIKRAELIRKNI